MKRLLAISLTMSLLVVAIVGCAGKPDSESGVSLPIKPASVDRATPEDIAAATRSGNEFALDLFGRLDKKSNLFFSPLSISSALTMTYAGARGQTAAEMAKVLHFTLDNQHLHPAFAALVWQVQGGGEQRGYRLNIANSLWGDANARFQADFLQLMTDNYIAGLQQVDFRKTEDARHQINAWVARQTADKIEELIQANDIAEDTRLVLVNAIYFKGLWQHAFETGNTREQPFHVAPSEQLSTPMMHQTAAFGYFADKADSFQLLEMTYKDSELSMVVLLPRRADGLASFEKEVTVDALMNWLRQVERRRVRVTLPKFQMRRRLDLAAALRALGMQAAFEPSGADFSGMTGDRPLFVSKVVHEAWLDVDEKGAEAAAATGVAYKKSDEPSEPTADFRADHPFLFLLRDKRSGSILFLGRLSNPKS